MNRTFLTFFVIALFAAMPSRADPVPVSLVTDDNHFPYAYLDQGKPAGLYVKIVETIAAGMPNYSVRIIAVPWKRALHLAETGEAAGIFPPHHFPAQRPYLELYSDPILSETPVLQCNDATLAEHGIDRKKASWPADYAGASIVAAMGTHMGGDQLWNVFAANRITVTPSGGIMENLRTLAHGRVDCMLNDRLTVQAATAWLAKHEPGLPMAGIAEAMSFPVEPGYLALSRPAALREPVRQAFLDEFNTLLRHMRDEGALDRITEEYLKQLSN